MKLSRMSTKDESISSFEFSSPSLDNDTSSAQGVVVISSSSESLSGPSPASSQTCSITSRIYNNTHPQSPDWCTHDEWVDEKCLLHSIWASVEALSNHRLNAQGFTKVNADTDHNDDLLLNVATTKILLLFENPNRTGRLTSFMFMTSFSLTSS